MEQYDLTDPKEAGRFAQMVSEVTGHKVHFVFTYAVETDDQWATGAVSNVEPKMACKLLIGGAEALATKHNFEEVTLRDN